MPSPSVSPVTRPKSVSTPTFPVGIEVVLHSNRSTTRIERPQRRILAPAPRKLGISGIDPPKFAPPRELSAISASMATPLPKLCTHRRRVRPLPSIFHYVRDA